MPIPVFPVPQDEFPVVTYLHPLEARRLLQQRHVRRSAVQFPVDRPPSPQDREWMEAAQQQYDAWLVACIKAEQTLILFLD